MSPALPTRLSPTNTLPDRISACARVRLSARPRATSSWSARTLAPTIFLLRFGLAVLQFSFGLCLRRRRGGGLDAAIAALVLQAKAEEDREMVRTDIRQAVQFNQFEVWRYEQVIQRPAEQRIFGIEGRV